MAKTSMKIKQARPAKFSTRKYNRCKLCGRPHAYLRNYGVCRICFRELAYKGEIPACGRHPSKKMIMAQRKTLTNRVFLGTLTKWGISPEMRPLRHVRTTLRCPG